MWTHWGISGWTLKSNIFYKMLLQLMWNVVKHQYSSLLLKSFSVGFFIMNGLYSLTDWLSSHLSVIDLSAGVSSSTRLSAELQVGWAGLTSKVAASEREERNVPEITFYNQMIHVRRRIKNKRTKKWRIEKYISLILMKENYPYSPLH